MESKGLAETSLRRGHGSVQVERLYKKQPAIYRKIWFQTTIVGRFKYPFRRRRLHVSTRVSKPIQEDVFSLVIFTTYIHLLHPDLLIRSIDRSRAEQSFGSESFDRRDSRYVAWAECATFARFNNLPLACSYRAQIRFFIAESATNAPQLDADLVTMKEGDRGLGASKSKRTLRELRDRNFFAIFWPRVHNFQKTLVGVFFTILSGVAVNWTIIISCQEFSRWPAALFNGNCNVIADDHV